MDASKITGNQREEVAWFWMRIFPEGEVAVRSLDVASLMTVSIGQEDGTQGFARFHANRVARHHIGPVIEIGDAPEAFRLTLGAIYAVGLKKAGELRVANGVTLGFNFEREGRGRDI